MSLSGHGENSRDFTNLDFRQRRVFMNPEPFFEYLHDRGKHTTVLVIKE
ncbi:hypothetical protein DSOL_2083 [Desulfosporosinus metallidurans]|uniref:Uncharacterized protein n=1 Tax=Desulfosporosinus metallidurans TaxID=1888891 RepID=A0A1Q8QXP1_9FIRM|nr:hypothetical protein DSOL_2083 [Desulfosporosinus metallidurans]